MDVRSSLRRGHLHAMARAPRTKPLLVAIGNCQISAVSVLLKHSAPFRDSYRVAALPGVHEIPAADVPLLHSLVRRASVLLTQQVREDYRGLEVGTATLSNLLDSGARHLLMSTVYFRGDHPTTVYVHRADGAAVRAPLTAEYHDLRFIAAAAAFEDDAVALRHLEHEVIEPEVLQRVRVESEEELRRRDEKVDIPSADLLQEVVAKPGVWTPNHPTNAVVQGLASRIAVSLGLADLTQTTRPELLGEIRIPALGGPGSSKRRAWMIHGSPVDESEIFRQHLAFYRSRPDVLSLALSEHASSLELMGLQA
ncbi:WcbI family polysaccharide biosynthesis putative acetyltransferase [Aeromicrobium sp.]|uniref:WcbI family polysaccharide biosynthesis putative acetyltransferase n=2 Tax=Aeromicrobium sp. TaxID=1871063 RepID=UPI0035176F98